MSVLSEKIGRPGPARSRRRHGKLRDLVAEVEREAIEDAMGTHQGNKSRMAEQLGITRYTLLQKMREFGLADP